VCIVYSYLQYCTAIWYILWQFYIFYGRLVFFQCVGLLQQEKSGNPVSDPGTQNDGKAYIEISVVILFKHLRP
jgi:hypothetical protein